MKNSFPDKSLIYPTGKVSHYLSASPFPQNEVAFTRMTSAYPFLHSHDYFEILVVVSGEFTNYVNGHAYAMRAGDAFFTRPHDTHKLLSTDSGAVHNINFLMQPPYVKHVLENYQSGLYENILAEEKELCFKLPIRMISEISNTCMLMQSNTLSDQERALHCKLITGNLINVFLNQYLLPPSAFPAWLFDLLYILHDPHLELDVNELAKTTSYSYSRLSRIFKELMGMSIVDYSRRVKMDYAAELLRNTKTPVTEIVAELNYTSISYFNHMFKKTFGITPSQMRKNK